MTKAMAGNLQRGVKLILHQRNNFPLVDTHGVAVSSGMGVLISMELFKVTHSNISLELI